MPLRPPAGLACPRGLGPVPWSPSNPSCSPAVAIFADLLFLAAGDLFRRRRRGMRAIQIPLLRDTDQTTRENIQRESAGKRENNEAAREHDRHDLHHLCLLRIG